MNILLINNDTVVEKLVRLSTKKRGDRLFVTSNIDAIEPCSVDLLILDGTLFNATFIAALDEKVTFAHSIYITTRESQQNELFEKTLYKPFLPSELLFELQQISSYFQNDVPIANPIVEQARPAPEDESDDLEAILQKSSYEGDVEAIQEDRELALLLDEPTQEPLEAYENSEDALEGIERTLESYDEAYEDALIEEFGEEPATFKEVALEVEDHEEDLSEVNEEEQLHFSDEVDEDIVEEEALDVEDEKEVMLNKIFSDEEVSEVQAILDVLDEIEPEECGEHIGTDEAAEAVVEEAPTDEDEMPLKQEEQITSEEIEEEKPEDEVDEALEAALAKMSTTQDNVQTIADIDLSDIPEMKMGSLQDNAQTIETLQTLIAALQNPQLANALKGKVNINLTFGDVDE